MFTGFGVGLKAESGPIKNEERERAASMRTRKKLLMSSWINKLPLKFRSSSFLLSCKQTLLVNWMTCCAARLQKDYWFNMHNAWVLICLRCHYSKIQRRAPCHWHMWTGGEEKLCNFRVPQGDCLEKIKFEGLIKIASRILWLNKEL